MLVSSFSKRLNEAMTFRNIKATEIVKTSERLYKLGEINKPLNKPLISHYLKGTYEAKQDNVYALSIILDVDEAWLMGYDVDMKRQIKNNIENEIPLITKFEKTLKNSIEQYCIGYLSINSEHYDFKNCFALQIQDDNSMAPLLDKSDIAIIHLQNSYESGKTFLISIDEKTLLIRKLLTLSNKNIELHAMNPYYPVIHLKEQDIHQKNIKIIGQVIKVENTTALGLSKEDK